MFLLTVNPSNDPKSQGTLFWTTVKADWDAFTLNQAGCVNAFDDGTKVSLSRRFTIGPVSVRDLTWTFPFAADVTSSSGDYPVGPVYGILYPLGEHCGWWELDSVSNLDGGNGKH